jgi:hypothetical protein
MCLYLLLIILLLSNATKQLNPRFHDVSFAQLSINLHRLADTYPEIIRLTSCQEEEYGGLGALQTCGGPCLQHVAILEANTSSLDDDRLTDDDTPEVFFSGALHGDERVGPLTLLIAIELLAEAHTRVSSSLAQQPKLATSDTDRWLYRLVQSRRMVFLLAANAEGFHYNVRGEPSASNSANEPGHNDPNRDFPYSTTDDQCMRTMAARCVNEIWRRHMFRTAITFHGGDELIGYEWGSPNHIATRPTHDHLTRRLTDVVEAMPPRRSTEAPDCESMRDIARFLSAFAGWGPTDQHPYRVGPLSDIIYDVSGGMEEWAYAASWEAYAGSSKLIPQCRPRSYGGYPIERCIYNNSTHRALNFLVESSFEKHPPRDELGSSQDLLVLHGAGDGHVARNVRLLLAASDFAEPYVEILALHVVGGEAQRNLFFQVAWRVGGAVRVDETQLFLAGPVDSCRERFHRQNWNQAFNISGEFIPVHSPQNGSGRWGDSPDPAVFARARGPFTFNTSDPEQLAQCKPEQGVYKEAVHVAGNFGDAFAFVVRAAVDRTWYSQHNPDPALSPQSHLVNSRLNEHWTHRLILPMHRPKRIQGSRWWYSEVRCMRLHK